jgi:hypothetical protein
MGPVCTLAVTYPNGKAAATGSAVHTTNSWVWSWAIPSIAGVGTASARFGCTYAGLTKLGKGSFQIVYAGPTPTPKPTPTPIWVWSLSGTVTPPTTLGGYALFHGIVGGTPPPDPGGLGPFDLNCSFIATGPGGVINQSLYTHIQSREFDMQARLLPASAGTWKWTAECHPAGYSGRSVAGSFVLS